MTPTYDTPEVREICRDVRGLPMARRMYTELSRIAAHPEATLQDLGHVIEADPVLAAAVLQLVNSVFFGRMRRFVTIKQAVDTLGADMLKSLVLSAHMASLTVAKSPPGMSVEIFQSHSVRVAKLAQRFLSDAEQADLAFTTCLLVDIGQLVLAICRPSTYRAILDAMRETGHAQHIVERALLGVTHAEIGAFVLATWGLPEQVVSCVALSHNTRAASDAYLAVHAAIHAADALLGIASCNDPEDSLDTDLVRRAGLESEMPRWRSLVEEELELARR